jgi:hypothetical protein
MRAPIQHVGAAREREGMNHHLKKRVFKLAASSSGAVASTRSQHTAESMMAEAVPMKMVPRCFREVSPSVADSFDRLSMRYREYRSHAPTETPAIPDTNEIVIMTG